MEISVASLVDGSPGRGLEFIAGIARAVEECGFAGYWSPDHLILVDEIESVYPYSDDGDPKFKKDQGFMGAMLVLAVAASVTSRIRLGTSIDVVPLREPISRAKDVATLDVLSGGRVVYGVGTGWIREEFDACGVAFKKRGRRADEFLAACKVLWTDERSTFKGDFFNFESVALFPKPLQRPHPVIMVGGNTEPALRRASRHGDGWYGWNLSIVELDKCLSSLEHHLASAGRSRVGFRVAVGCPHGGGPDAIREYRDLLGERGVDELVLGMGLSHRRFQAQLEANAELIPA